MKTTLPVKLAICGGLALAFLLVLGRIQAVIDDRQGRSGEAIAEVTGKWGAPQSVLGPVLIVPYRVDFRDKDGLAQSRRETAVLLPDRLAVDGTLTPEVRRRGLFGVVVYTATLKLTGSFPALDPAALGVSADHLLLDQARVSLGVSDARGIQQAPKMEWDGAPLVARPGPGGSPLAQAGLHAPVPPGGDASSVGAPHPFRLEIVLRGTKDLSIAPLGVETAVALRSPWRSPSFMGAFLPESRSVSPAGFTAAWKVAHFGRSYGQIWKSDGASAEALSLAVCGSTFGVTLFQPAACYQQSTRSVKYGLLFVLLTFAAFFLFETLSPATGPGEERLDVHPIQYLFVGLALCLFYLLLVSLSERLGFGRAYALAAAATILLVTGYAASVLRRRRRALVIGGLLTALYGALFALLRVEDDALLIGSLTLFALLAAVMYGTRRVDWYAVGGGAPGEPTVR